MNTTDRIKFASLEAKTPAQRERETVEALAQKHGYTTKRIRGRWVVWCEESDHAVEF